MSFSLGDAPLRQGVGNPRSKDDTGAAFSCGGSDMVWRGESGIDGGGKQGFGGSGRSEAGRSETARGGPNEVLHPKWRPMSLSVGVGSKDTIDDVQAMELASNCGYETGPRLSEKQRETSEPTSRAACGVEQLLAAMFDADARVRPAVGVGRQAGAACSGSSMKEPMSRSEAE